MGGMKRASEDSCAVCNAIKFAVADALHEYDKQTYERCAKHMRTARREALDAAREAVAKQKLVPLAKQGRFIITRNTKLWKQRQAWSELGWWDFRTSALAAIDALREEEK